MDAAAVGVKNFKALYKAYRDAMRGEFVPENHSTDVQGQALDLNCGDWLVDEYGVRRGIGGSETVA